jgi:hypothetical protein
MLKKKRRDILLFNMGLLLFFIAVLLLRCRQSEGDGQEVQSECDEVGYPGGESMRTAMIVTAAGASEARGDERSLGDGSFVEEVLKVCQGRPDGLFSACSSKANG